MAQSTTDGPALQERCIHRLFEAQVLATPGALSVVTDNASLSYADLNAQANRLAYHLRSRGVSPDTRVAIAVDRGIEMVVGILATLKAGGCYLLIDRSHPTDRILQILDESDASIVLRYGPSIGSEVPPTSTRTYVDLASDALSWQANPSTNPEPDDLGLGARHLAYVIYTSGSAGKPKGVAIEHRGLANLVAAQIEYLQIPRGSQVLQVSSVNFDASVIEIFMALCSGSTLHFAPPGTVLVGETLARVIERGAITHLTLTPTVLETLPRSSALASVQTLVVAGEALARASVRQWGTGRRIINAYGPTEATVCATWHDCKADGERAPPIGRPLPNVSVHILDQDGNLLPDGETGELFIGGVGVARGYLARPDLTAERFLCDPFSARPGARMFKTGDIGRRLPDGNIEFLGRNDSQLKIHGIRIEPGEVEANLTTHPDLLQARVIPRENTPGHTRLVAYYTAREDRRIQPGTLRDHLARTLPEAMLPVAYVKLHAMPVTANGKIDSKELPPPRHEDYATSPFESPDGESEEAIASFWIEVLGVERVGRNDHFFRLGGDSLRAVLLVSRIRARFASDVSVKSVFGCPVFRDFVGNLGPLRPAEVAPHQLNQEEKRVLSSAQKRLWFLAQISPLSSAYNVSIGPHSWRSPTGMRLNGVLDRRALRCALNELCMRHESLRTSFATVEGEPTPRIARDSPPMPFMEHDLRGRADAPAELARLKLEETATAFDLEKNQPIRARLIQLTNDEHVLLLTAHHIACDGWSAEILLTELGMLYSKYSGASSARIENECRPTDYTLCTPPAIAEDVLAEQIGYWKRELSGAPPWLDLPTDRPRPVKQDFAGDDVDLELDHALTTQLRELSNVRGVTLYTIVLAAWAALLARLSGQDDLVIGTPVAGRTRLDVEKLVGCFVNTVALRIDSSGDPTAAELIDRVAQRSLDATEHQDFPFDKVVDLIKPLRDLSRTPLFQVMFSWQNQEHGRIDLPGILVTPEGLPSFGAKFDLELRLGEANGKIVGALEYSSSLYDRSTMERHVEYLRLILHEIVQNPSRPITDIDLMNNSEKRLLLQISETANVPSVSTEPQCVHALFERQAARTPQAIAVEYADHELTYSELNSKAGRLERSLRRLGVKPNSRVAICVERSLEMVIAVLGALKAGGAYVPLDPSYPVDRLAHMLTESDAEVLIVHGRTPHAIQERLRAERSIPVIDLDRDAARNGDVADDGCAPSEAAPTGENLAYVLFTSGSTGNPKGVAMPHSVLFNLIQWQTSSSSSYSTLQFAPLSFDVSFQEIFTALCSGSRLVLMDNQTRQDPQKLLSLIRSRQVERLFLPYVALRMLAESLENDSLEDCPLREVITAGEQLRITPAIARFFGAIANCRLHNHYGPTETHVVTYFSLPANCADWPTLPPIGRPIANARIYILDRLERLVPRGVVGELYIGGDVLARGYLQQATLTAARFLRDPFSSRPNALMYRTGDLVRYRGDGEIEFVGRNDHQVKIRGFRVELGEIESRLEAYPSVQHAVVVASGDTQRLVAYYVASAPVAADALKEHLADALPDYMLPTVCVQLDRLPLTPNGKVNRFALPPPPSPPIKGEAPRGNTEERVAGIWAELLEVDHVERSDNFFELGGNSLLATVLVRRIRSEFGVELEIEDVFSTAVLSAFARLVLIRQLARISRSQA